MRILVPLTAVILLALGFCLLFAAVSHAQVITVTNGGSLLTISNGLVVATTPLTNAAQVLVTTNGQVIPAALASQIATDLGIPSFVVSLIPLKLVPWIALIIFIIPYAGRAWHAYQSDGGAKGIFNAVVYGTNTPKQIVAATGQPVVPANVPETNINSAPVEKQPPQ